MPKLRVDHHTQVLGTFTSSVTEAGALGAGLGTISGDVSITADDPAHAAFQMPRASSLRGTYGQFTFSVDPIQTPEGDTLGHWTYQLNNAKANALRGDDVKFDTLKVSSLDGSSSETISVTVNGANDAPTIKTARTSITLVEASNNGFSGADTSRIKFSMADADRGDVASWNTDGWTLVSGNYKKAGVYGNAIFDITTGTVSYKLDNSLAATNALASRVLVHDSFDVTATDLFGASTTTSAVFNIKGTNDAPVAVADSLSYLKNTVMHYQAPLLLENDSDAENNDLHIFRVYNGTGGKVRLADDNSVTFTPNKDFEGDAQFSYIAWDGNATSGRTTVTLHVTGSAGGGGGVSVPPGQSVTIDSMTLDTGLLADDFITNDGTPGVPEVSNRTVSGQITAELTGNQIVEVSFDNGANWNTASISPGPMQWLVVDPGTHSDDWTIKARVTDLGTHLSGSVAQQLVTLDTVAPVFLYANVNNDQLVLSFQDGLLLDESVTPDSSAFSVTINEEETFVSTVTVDAIAKTVTLTLSDGAGETSRVSIDYPGNAGIRDIAGNEALDFFRWSAYNDTPIGSYYAIAGDTAGSTAPLNNDSIQGLYGNDYIMGLTGNDTIDGNHGHDNISGDEGDDRIIVPDLYFDNIDGGDGTDTLVLSGAGLDLNLSDFRLPFGSRINSIEVIDLTGIGDNSLTLRASDLLDILSDPILIVEGDAGDQVHMNESYHRLWTQGDDTIINEVTYHSFSMDGFTVLTGVNVSVSGASPPEMP